MSWFDPERPREIVALAASNTKDPATKTWLLYDEKGMWENTAKKYLERVPELLVAKNLQLTDKQINEEIAVSLGLQALEATLSHIRKRKERKERKRR
jgi:hypothetical protein